MPYLIKENGKIVGYTKWQSSSHLDSEKVSEDDSRLVAFKEQGIEKEQQRDVDRKTLKDKFASGTASMAEVQATLAKLL